ncbi:MAG TPA: DUF5946 family protein [Vicinamibacterales bacterium]|nr:DUF5946 family protein [Vicinamibacterales bacterium]
MSAEEDAFHELCGYTLAHGDPAFIHQHVVDAFAVQQADERTKPIELTFGLLGLYLKVERQFTGKEVQRAHMALGRQKHVWPSFVLPRDRGAVTAQTVLAARAGAERDRAIDAWCASVWQAFRENRDTIVGLLVAHGIIYY